jgi:septation ring formation regulator EzrA
MAVTIEEVFSAILSFREATDAFSLRMERRFDGVDARLDGIDARLEGHDRRFDQLDVRIGRIETRIEHLEDGQREIRNELVEMNQRFR